MNKKYGISMIVLSITILVMAILAATAIIALEDTGIIGRSKNVVSNTNYESEYTRLITVKNQVLGRSFGEITVDSYIAALKDKGIIEPNEIINPDYSKTVNTKTGYIVNIMQDGESNLVISLGTAGATLTIAPTTLTGDVTSGAITKNITVTSTNIKGNITWYSSDVNVATVNGTNEGATVTLKGIGNATIYAIYGNAKATCQVTTTGTEPAIILDKATISQELMNGATATATLTATKRNLTGEIYWISSNTSVATVSGNGNTATITMKAAGKTTIKAKIGDVTASCVVTVTEKIITGSTPLVANRPFTISDYSCTVEWSSNVSEYTILCDAMDKNYNPVYVLKAGMTKAEYDAMGLKFRKGSWIYINKGTYVTMSSTFYATGDIYDAKGALVSGYNCPMYQVNGNGTINVHSTAGSIKTQNSKYTTILDNGYSRTKYIDIFSGLAQTTSIIGATKMMMFDGYNASTEGGAFTVPIDVTLEYWKQLGSYTFVAGSLIFAQSELPGKVVKVASGDGFNVYIVAE